jgi:radical SAM protein with 4Fe4S-binding SPASM domain
MPLGLPLSLRQWRIALSALDDSRTSCDGACAGGGVPDLAWVDEWAARVKPYVFVRLEDSLLIKRPNNAQKLNATGAQVLKLLLDGTPIARVLQAAGTVERQRQIACFLYAVKSHLEGTFDEMVTHPAVDVVPFDMRFSTYPVLSEIALTYRCNLRCAFCYAGCNCTSNPAGTDEEMRTDAVRRLLRILYNDARVPSVSFTGGEPTLVPELAGLVRDAVDIGMRVNLITNGTRITPEYAARLADAGLHSAQVSLEGTCAATHDGIVGQAGAFERSVAGIRALAGTGIRVHSNTTICRANLSECVAFPRFVAAELELPRFSMNLIIPTGSSTVHDEQIVHYHEIGATLEHVIDAAEQEEVEFMWYSPVPMCMFNSVAHGLGNKGCSACDGLISVAPNGDVLPCASYDDPVGNLLRQPFDEVWQSRRAARYREKQLAHALCQSCEHFHICNGACPLYWRSVGYRELLNVQQGVPDHAVA